MVHLFRPKTDWRNVEGKSTTLRRLVFIYLFQYFFYFVPVPYLILIHPRWITSDLSVKITLLYYCVDLILFLDPYTSPLFRTKSFSLVINATGLEPCMTIARVICSRGPSTGRSSVTVLRSGSDLVSQEENIEKNFSKLLTGFPMLCVEIN